MEDIFNGSKKLGFGLMRLPLLNQNEASSIDMELELMGYVKQNTPGYFGTSAN